MIQWVRCFILPHSSTLPLRLNGVTHSHCIPLIFSSATTNYLSSSPMLYVLLCFHISCITFSTNCSWESPSLGMSMRLAILSSSPGISVRHCLASLGRYVQAWSMMKMLDRDWRQICNDNTKWDKYQTSVWFSLSSELSRNCSLQSWYHSHTLAGN